MKNIRSKNPIRFVAILLVASLFVAPLFASPEDVPEPFDPLALSEESRQAYDQLQDYTATFLKQERIGGKMGDLETIKFKYRKPNDVYMKWIEKPNKGQEAIYRKDHNNNRVKAHKGGFMNILNINLAPENKLIMDGQHHRIIDAGIGPTGKLVMRGLKRGLKRNEVRVVKHGIVKLNGRDMIKVEATFPEKMEGTSYEVQKDETLWDISNKFDQDMYVIMNCNKGIDSPTDIKAGQKIIIPHHYGHKTISYIDNETKLLSKLEIFDWNNQLYEYYEYKNVQLNVGLTDLDFDPANPNYGF